MRLISFSKGETPSGSSPRSFVIVAHVVVCRRILFRGAYEDVCRRILFRGACAMLSSSRSASSPFDQ
jgi:hypothetical protein